MEEALTTPPQPPSPAATSGVLRCPQCQRANPAGRRFCGGCGQSLWQRCPVCKAECSADERFCGSCGGDIRTELHEQTSRHQQSLERALQLGEQHQYAEAYDALQAVAEATDPRLEALARRALAEISRLQVQEQNEQAAAAAALGEGQKLFALHAYEQAIAALDRTPLPLCTDEHALLLSKARACRQEVQTLSGEIRAAVEQKRFGEILPKLERLLVLKPNQPQARQLAEQLRDSLVRLAEGKLARHKYREALDQLVRIPLAVRTPETDALLERVSELQCLVAETQSAALADQNLLALVERLCTLVPDYPSGEKLRVQVRQRMDKKPDDPRLGAANWAAPPARSPLGPPVDWLAHPIQTPAAEPAVALALHQRPGQFFVALGLALQALGQAVCGVNLLPRESGSLLSSLPALSLGRRSPAAAWGLDFGETALRAIKLTRDAKSGALLLAAAELIPHERALNHPAAEQQRGPIAERTLETFLSRAGELKGIRIGASLPGSRVIGRFFELPPRPAKKVADSVQYEARHQLPMALDELCWGYAIQDELDGKDHSPRQVFIEASRRAQVSERLALLERAGISVDVLQSDCVALHNALVYEFWPDGQPAAAGAAGSAVAVLDVGAESGNIVISAPRCVWFRNFGHGGDSFTRELCKTLQLTSEQAGQVKRQPALAESYHRLDAAWRPLWVQLASELDRSLAMHRKLYPDYPVGHIYGLGGGFQTQGLLRYLRTGK